jgi:predicted outer membrane repeat protein
LRDSVFEENEASESGGAVYLSCTKIDISNKVSFSFANLSFYSNKAKIEGGALMILNEYC